MNMNSKLRVFGNLALDWIAAMGIPGKRHGIALIKIDAIGDFLLWLHAAEAISREYGPENIVLIVSRPNADLARTLPFWRDVVALDTNAFVHDRASRSRTIREIRRMRFDVAIHCTHSRVFETGDAVLRATGARLRIGSNGDLWNISRVKKRIADRWYTQLLPSATVQCHESLRHEKFLRALGLDGYRAGIYHLPTQVVDSHNSNHTSMNYFVVFPGASWNGRKWEIEKFAELIDRLQVLTCLECILCGSESERELCSSIANSCQATRKIHNMAGNNSLSAFLELVRSARFLIGNETMCIQAAAVVRTPAVCILGGGHYGCFAPYSDAGFEHDVEQYAAHSKEMHCFHCNWVCTEGYSGCGPVPCIEKIDVDSVYRLCETLWLKQQGGSGR